MTSWADFLIMSLHQKSHHDDGIWCFWYDCSTLKHPNIRHAQKQRTHLTKQG